MKIKIESIHIRNFKAFKDVQVKNIPSLAVFLGSNGAGKSTFFDVFGFLKDALHDNVNIALNKRGGFAEVISRECNIEKDKIYIEIKFRNKDLETDGSSPLITYSLELGFRSEKNHVDSGKAYVQREMLKYRRGNRGAPWHFLDFKNGNGLAIVNEEDYGKAGVKEEREEQRVSRPDILAIKGLGQFEKFKAISSFRHLLEKWYISDFKIDCGRIVSDTGISDHLSVSGDNFAQVTKYMYEYHRQTFDSILEKLPQRIPGISQVEAKETEDGRIVLKFKDENFLDPFLARYVSDGTIKMFAYMILLNDPDPHPLLCIEEPENFLHPDLLPQLCEEIREYSDRGGQVFVSTHSPDFVNGLQTDELFCLVKQRGYTKIEAAGNDRELKELATTNKLGWLWRGRYIKGANL